MLMKCDWLNAQFNELRQHCSRRVVSMAMRPRLVIVNEILSDKALVKVIMTDAVDWLLWHQPQNRHTTSRSRQVGIPSLISCIYTSKTTPGEGTEKSPALGFSVCNRVRRDRLGAAPLLQTGVVPHRSRAPADSGQAVFTVHVCRWWAEAGGGGGGPQLLDFQSGICWGWREKDGEQVTDGTEYAPSQRSGETSWKSKDQPSRLMTEK